MSITDDLFLAILAMDAYNRGYNAGIGNNTVGLGGIGSQIGTATVTRQDSSTEAFAASFFAQAYTWNGQTVISYRGTDQFGLDIANGYGLATGNSRAPQGLMALDFYRSVIDADANPQTANVTLTGHSLGGGLAALC